MSTSTYLTNSDLDTEDIYGTTYGKVLSAYMSPVCPSTTTGQTQVYNPDNGVCTAVPAATAMASGNTATGCGGQPFQVQAGNTCFSTNTCPTSSSLTTTCLNGQHVPVRQLPISGPGVIYNSVYAGDANNYWRWA